MSPVPVVSALAQRIYEEVLPLAYADQDHDYALLRFIDAWTQDLAELEFITSDSDDGPGWSAALDIDRVPDSFLRWLAQFMGVNTTGGESNESIRTSIETAAGLRRGSPDSLVAAVKATLDGTKSVQLIERHGSAYKLTVTVLDAETHDPDATLRSALSQKPAGIVLTLGIVTGNNWDALKNTHASWNEVQTDFANWNAVLADPTHT